MSEAYRSGAKFVDVVAGFGSEAHPLYRFPIDKTGHDRAVEYRNAYNKALREHQGIADADLDLEPADYTKRLDEYEQAQSVELRYSTKAARLSYVYPPTFVSNYVPLPTDYPFN